MPTMVLAARLCPLGIEATMFATIMSLINMADGVRQAGGAALITALGITGTDFDNLPLALVICDLCLLLPLPLLALVPDKLVKDVGEHGEEQHGEGLGVAGGTGKPAVLTQTAGDAVSAVSAMSGASSAARQGAAPLGSESTILAATSETHTGTGVVGGVEGGSQTMAEIVTEVSKHFRLHDPASSEAGGNGAYNTTSPAGDMSHLHGTSKDVNEEVVGDGSWAGALPAMHAAVMAGSAVDLTKSQEELQLRRQQQLLDDQADIDALEVDQPPYLNNIVPLPSLTTPVALVSQQDKQYSQHAGEQGRSEQE